MDDAASKHGRATASDEIHVIERGDSWEVWRRGDSMPLGTYVTRGEAEERAETAAAAAGGSEPVHDDLEGLAEDPATGSTPSDPTAEASGLPPGGTDPMGGTAPTS
jgi:hypothetical protein